MEESIRNPLCLQAREALSPPLAEDTLRKLYALAFPWPAPKEYGERELTEALLRVRDVPEETP